MYDDLTPITLTPIDKALIAAYRTLATFAVDEGWAPAEKENDPALYERTLAAMTEIEDALPVEVRATILPAYTKVRFTRNGGTVEGQTRDGAWGLHHDSRSGVYPRRVTTTMGWEVWIGPDVTDFEILARP